MKNECNQSGGIERKCVEGGDVDERESFPLFFIQFHIAAISCLIIIFLYIWNSWRKYPVKIEA